MGPTDLLRYKRLLLEKRRELSSAHSEASAHVPAAGGWDGDVIDQANADAEGELQIRLHRTDGRQVRAIDDALGGIQERTFCVFEACKGTISKARIEAVP